MKQFCLLLCSMGSFLFARSQDPEYPVAPAAAPHIIAAEYFIDNDPGFGNASPIHVNFATDISGISVSVNTSGLSNGVHKVYIRTKTSDEKWSLTISQSFIADADPAYPIQPAAAQNIVAAEYFLDEDPGFGNALPITVSNGIDINNITASMNTAGLSNGVHRVFLRTKNADGAWSHTIVRNFIVDTDPPYPAPPAAMQNIVAAEYFIDDDPGFGNATPIAMSEGDDISNIHYQANVAGLTNGVHNIFIRTKEANGKWTLTLRNNFTVDQDYAYPSVPGAPADIVYAEYFFDQDPGFGNGTTIAITPGTDISNMTISASTASLADGAHTFYIRSKSNWSITNFVPFVKGQVLPLQFLNISAAASGKNVIVNWTTANEVNASHFIVEYSTDGLNFTATGTVNAYNSNGTHHYHFEHRNVSKGFIYFRIKQVDTDGRFTYSAIVKLNIQDNDGIKLYPNPVVNDIWLQHADPTEIQMVEILSMEGKKVMHFNKPAVLKWNIEQLPASIYWLRIVRTDDTIHSLPFIKQ